MPLFVEKPYYVYLMKGSVTPAASRGNKRKRSATTAQATRVYIHIGKSRAPVKKVYRHNNQTVRVLSNAKYIARVAKNWRLYDWCGPFMSRERARQFQQLWFEQLRKRLPPPRPLDNACYFSAFAPLVAVKA